MPRFKDGCYGLGLEGEAVELELLYLCRTGVCGEDREGPALPAEAGQGFLSTVGWDCGRRTQSGLAWAVHIWDMQVPLLRH